MQSQTLRRNKHPESHWILLVLEVFALHSCLSRCLQQQSEDVTCYMLTADWNWRGNYNITERRGEKKRENQSFWWVLSEVRVDLNLNTHNLSVCADAQQLLTNV